MRAYMIIGFLGLLAGCPQVLMGDEAAGVHTAATSSPAEGDGQTKAAIRALFPYPRLTPEQRPLKAREALDPSTDEKARFTAVWGLAISGYSREGAEALAIIASDSRYIVNTRGYAGMGLSNFSHAIPEGVRRGILDRLYGALNAEKEKLPDGVMRTLIDWGEADRVRAVLGQTLRGHPMEIEVLQRIGPRGEAIERLMDVYETAPVVTSQIGWTKRWNVGAALIKRLDKRGVDILIECLTVKTPWRTDDVSPQAVDSNAHSFRQPLQNTFDWLAPIFDDRFGYLASNTWTPQLDDAIPRMAGWWKANRSTWSFEDSKSTELPALQEGRELINRQARVLAAKLANDAFAERTFTHADGRQVGKIEIVPESFNEVTRKNGRWVLRMVRSRGPEAIVEFDADGLNQKVVVNYAWD